MGKETTYGVWAVRSGASIFGHAEAWCKEDGKPLEFDSREAAEAYAKEMNSKTSANVHYYAQEKEPELGAVRKTSPAYKRSCIGVALNDSILLDNKIGISFQSIFNALLELR